MLASEDKDCNRSLWHEAPVRYFYIRRYLCAPCVFLRKNQPVRHTATANTATITEPTSPETLVPAALSLPAKE